MTKVEKLTKIFTKYVQIKLELEGVSIEEKIQSEESYLRQLKFLIVNADNLAEEYQSVADDIYNRSGKWVPLLEEQSLLDQLNTIYSECKSIYNDKSKKLC